MIGSDCDASNGGSLQLKWNVIVTRRIKKQTQRGLEC
ncbi:unnamed protein product [Rhodiola kirilowii]